MRVRTRATDNVSRSAATQRLPAGLSQSGIAPRSTKALRVAAAGWQPNIAQATRTDGKLLTGRERIRRGLTLVLAQALLASCDSGVVRSPESSEAHQAVVPPSIRKTVQYRCEDGRDASVDFFDDGRSVFLRQDGGIRKLVAPKAGAPFSTDSLTLTSEGNKLTLTRRGGKSVHCQS